jgi:hypothetical protein
MGRRWGSNSGLSLGLQPIRKDLPNLGPIRVHVQNVQGGVGVNLAVKGLVAVRAFFRPFLFGIPVAVTNDLSF